MAEERQETGKKKGNEKGEVSRNLPRNYRQIGEPGAKKIYVEDYVYTYLNKLAQPENLYARGAVLFGKMYKTSIGKCIFISGAAACQNFELDLEETIFSEESWGEIYRIRDSFFPEMEICGWFLSRMGFSVDLNDKIIRIHMDNFRGENKVLYMIDSLENEDVVVRRSKIPVSGASSGSEIEDRHFSGQTVLYAVNKAGKSVNVDRLRRIKINGSPVFLRLGNKDLTVKKKVVDRYGTDGSARVRQLIGKYSRRRCLSGAGRTCKRNESQPRPVQHRIRRRIHASPEAHLAGRGKQRLCVVVRKPVINIFHRYYHKISPFMGGTRGHYHKYFLFKSSWNS